MIEISQHSTLVNKVALHYLQVLNVLRTAMPDLLCTVQERFFDGDRAIARIIFSGTHTGNFLSAPATGKPIQFIAFDIHRIYDGQIVES